MVTAATTIALVAPSLIISAQSDIEIGAMAAYERRAASSAKVG